MKVQITNLTNNLEQVLIKNNYSTKNIFYVITNDIKELAMFNELVEIQIIHNKAQSFTRSEATELHDYLFKKGFNCSLNTLTFRTSIKWYVKFYISKYLL